MSTVTGSAMRSRRSDRVETPAPAKVVRAAVYCRKSTDENLHSDFNSLDAQREACLAYITSMKSEGWMALEQTYEDAAVSGGTVDRPALKQMLTDIESGMIDAVVVVKLDRLSRSLSQFLQLMEFMEDYNVAFCAVTQQINTASSAGRLLVNVLMSFAQFEREIGSERTREKVQAARKKGRYIGGHPPLGYDVDPATHQLTVNRREAEIVRELFHLYLERRSLLEVVKEVNARGWTKKSWQNSRGVYRNGSPLDKVYLQRLIVNPLYIGRVKLHGNTYDGLQEAIIDDVTFARVQQLLANNRNGRSIGPGTRNKHAALLGSLIKCGVCGKAMAHSYAKRGSRLFRYYRCTTAQKVGRDACPAPNLAAAEIEEFVVEQVRGMARDPDPARTTSSIVSNNGDGETECRSDVAHDQFVGRLAELDSTWDVLIPHEKCKLLAALVQRVVCTVDGDVQITFRPLE